MRASPTLALTFALLAPLGCKSRYEEPASSPAAPDQAKAPSDGLAQNQPAAQTPAATAAPAPTPAPTASQPEVVTSAALPDGGDPAAGKFSLVEATKGLPAKGKLVADIVTSLGKLSCELYDDKAPNTVANFIGLARGLRPWKAPDGTWVKKPLYDGTIFHRIIKGFMIQGGDPMGTGAGEPGYVIPDEVWPGAAHDRRGLLCMANRGKNTNGAQFFILDAAARHLDSGYTIFGSCGPDSAIEALASAPVNGERPVTPPKINKVTIHRK